MSEELLKTIREVCGATEKLKSVVPYLMFKDVVKATSGYDVIPFDIWNPFDAELYDVLSRSATNLIHFGKRTHQRFEGQRINEIGKRIEEVYVEELKKSKVTPTQLKIAGYPDIRLLDRRGRVTYLESKTTTVTENTTFRSFYYSNGKKIDSDARHLQIVWLIKKDQGNYWYLKDWKILDLALLEIRTKLEFYSTNELLYERDLVIGESHE